MNVLDRPRRMHTKLVKQLYSDGAVYFVVMNNASSVLRHPFICHITRIQITLCTPDYFLQNCPDLTIPYFQLYASSTYLLYLKRMSAAF
jgi:hypothetical protein